MLLAWPVLIRCVTALWSPRDGFSCRRRFSNEDSKGDLTPFYVGLLVDAVLFVTKTLVDCVTSTATTSKQTMVLLCGQQMELGAAGSLLITV